MSKDTQTDIFGRETGEINGSLYTPWWKSHRFSLNGLYSNVYKATSTLKKSLKLHRHRKEVSNRIQIMDPTKLATASYKTSRISQLNKELKLPHIFRSMSTLFLGRMRILLDDMLANKKTVQKVDIGSAIHQKLHQMHSNRWIEVPYRYNGLMLWMYENKYISGWAHIIFGLSKCTDLRYDKTDIDLFGKYKKTAVVEYGVVDGKLCLPLSIFNQLKKNLLKSTAHTVNGMDFDLAKIIFKHRTKEGPEDYDYDYEQKFVDERSKSGHILAVVQEEIIHMLEDVYVDDQLAKSSPGYVHYLADYKKHIVKDTKWIEQELKDYEEPFYKIARGYIEYVVTQLEENKSLSLAEIKDIIWPLKELLTIMTATIMMRFIVYLPELINNAMKIHLDNALNLMDKFKRIGTFKGSSIFQEVFDSFQPIEPKSLEKHMNQFSHYIAKAGTDLLNDPDAVIKVSEEMFDYFYDYLSFIHNKAKKFSKIDLTEGLCRGDNAISGYESFSSNGYRNTKGISDRMAKELKNHKDNNTETFESKDPGLGTNNDASNKHRVIIDHYSKGNVEEYSNLRNELKTEINALRKRISLYGLDRHIQVRNLNRGEFDRKSLHKIPTGHVNLFKKEYIDHEPEMNIGILMDQSGSMCGEIHLVRDTAIILYEAMKDNNLCNIFLYGHTADKHSEGKSTHIFEYNTGPSLMNTESHSNNRDGVAIYETAKMMHAQIQAKSNVRNMLIVLCDGEPAAAGYYDGKEMTARSVANVEKGGISVTAIGMGRYVNKDNLDRMYNHFSQIESVKDIKETLPATIRKVLAI